MSSEPEEERKNFFGKLSTELANVAKRGFAALSFLVSLKRQSLQNYAIPISNANTFVNNQVDPISEQLYPNDAPKNLKPIQVFGDGNCFYRSLSILVCGHDQFYKEMLARTICEMVSNVKLYTESDTFSKMSEAPISIQYLYQTSMQTECIVNGDNLKTLKNDIIMSCKDGQYSSLLHVFVAANLLGRPIVTIFPNAPNPCINRGIHNQRIAPLSHDTDREAIHVMWTHISNTDMVGWAPNHFVACIPNVEPDSQPSPKRAKHDDGTFEKNDRQSSGEPDPDLSREVPPGTSTYSQQPKWAGGDRWQTPETGDAPNQPRKYSFPKTFFGEKRRGFDSSWFDRWNWLHYVECSDSVFCFVCITSYNKGSLACHKKESAFISKGFRNWKKATEYFSQHEKSDCHREAFEREFKLKSEVKDIGESISTQHKELKDRNRKNLLKIIDAIQYLSRQGIALRGDGDEKDSNFNQLLAVGAKHDPEFKDWLKQKTN